MALFKYAPWDQYYKITGTYDWHMNQSPFKPDPGVDYGLPFRTPIYTVFDEQWVQETTVTTAKDSLGIRKIVVIDERVNGVSTGRVFQVWHCDEVVYKVGTIIKGRQLVAYSGHSGAASNHGHCVLKLNGKKVDPTSYIEESFNMNTAQEAAYKTQAAADKENIRILTKELTEKNDNYVTTLKSLQEVSVDRDFIKGELDVANQKIEALNAELIRVKSESVPKVVVKPAVLIPSQTSSSILDIIYSLIRRK